MVTFNRYEELFKIMQEAFPEIEYRTKEHQEKLLSHHCYNVKTVTKGEELIGFAAFWELGSCRFIEHVATIPELRGSGIGKYLINLLISTTEKPIFLEVEPPEDEMTARRIEFYKRLGFHLNEFPYLQLPLRVGDEAQTLMVMSYPKPISADRFIPYKKEIYFEVYNSNKI